MKIEDQNSSDWLTDWLAGFFANLTESNLKNIHHTVHLKILCKYFEIVNFIASGNLCL